MDICEDSKASTAGSASSPRWILALPTVLVCEILQNWLAPKAWANLDSAVCNVEQRKLYSSLLASDQFALEGTPSIRVHLADHFHEWIIKRKIRIMAMGLYGSTSSSIVERVLNSDCGSLLRGLMFVGVWATMYTVCRNYCTDMRIIHCKRCFCTVDFYEILATSQGTLLDLRCTTCQNLNELEFSGLNFTVLHTLDLTDSGVNDACLVAASKAAPNLQRLVLDSCVELTSAAIVAAATNLPGLRVISVNGCSRVSDDAIVAVALGCPRIIIADISTTHITDASIIALAQNCRKLCRLYCHHNDQITNAAMVTLAVHCAGTLECLHVAHCPGITADGLCAMLRSCINLVTLQIGSGGGDHLMPESELARVIQCCGNVTNKLALLGAAAVTDKALVAFAQHCTRTMHLSLPRATGYTTTGLMHIVKRCGALQSILVSKHMTGLINPFACALWTHIRPRLVVSTDPDMHSYLVLQQRDVM
jgi:uncharacterized protein YjeT (DUF2065 family)